MQFSTEEIYLASGQFDKVVNIAFRPKSESYDLYGPNITGVFLYTPKQRNELQQAISGGGELIRSDGHIRFEEVLHDLTDEKRSKLEKEGILASDVIEILQFKGNMVNNFGNKSLRSLPEPIELKVNNKGVDYDILNMNMYSQMISNGYKLLQDETDSYYAAIYRKFKEQIPEQQYTEIFIDRETGQLKKGVEYHILESRFLSGEKLNDEDDARFKELLKERTSEKVSVAMNELRKSHEKLAEVGIKFPQAAGIISHLASVFNTERLTHGKFPIWWDFERFLHIYLRHVSETQIGDRFKDKTPFQYGIKDVKTLIELILEQEKEAIDEHFRNKPTSDFKRQGSMAVYYNGDYYNFHIASDGRLMAFYKSYPKPEQVEK